MTTKAQGHTPGPWEVRKYSDSTLKDAEGVFASEQNLPLVDQVWGSSIEQSDANARLIAAAPNLLEACRRVLDSPSEPDKWRIVVEAAIARAKGTVTP